MLLSQESIELSQRCLKSISQLESQNLSVVEKLCKYFLQMLIKQYSNIKIDETLDESLWAVSTILLEAVKCNSSEDQLRTFLSEHFVSKDIAAVLVDTYIQHKELMLKHVETGGISAWEIISLDWRIDFAIRSKQGGRDNTPVYLLELKVLDRGLPRIIDMTANEEELQDLIAKIQDAVKQTDRTIFRLSEV